ncbi:class I SAM-dependent methyltransferase [Streptomyces sp. ADI98-10]|uniref:class I SAM-dependent methyltransferase n=1 Tax=Streptomyces sp. ADI98-10 TaxID=1522763 RepID=UPI0032170782
MASASTAAGRRRARLSAGAARRPGTGRPKPRAGRRTVRDLASGTGFSNRELGRRGATDVLGVEISGEMVAAARGLERRDPPGVRYEVGDVSEPALPRADLRRPPGRPTAQLRGGHHRHGADVPQRCTGIRRPVASSSCSPRHPTSASTARPRSRTASAPR